MSIFLKILIVFMVLLILNLLAMIVAKQGKAKDSLYKFSFLLFVVTVLLMLLNIVIFKFFKGTVFASPYLLFLILPILLFWLAYPFLQKLYAPGLNYNLAYKPETSIPALTAKYFCFTLITLGLIFAVLALAKPRDAQKTVLPPTEGVDIILAIDTSGSMAAQDFDPNRITAAKVAAANFIANRLSDRIGIVVFASDAMLQSPLTLDYESLLDFLADVRIGMVRTDGTAIGDAIAVSSVHLERSPARSKVIILLTDGESNSGVISPLDAAKTAALYGIKVYTIATISKNSRDSLDFKPDDLEQIAKLTGGKYYRAYNEAELTKIYAEIDSLEKTEFKNSVLVNYRERYLPFLALSLILISCGFIFSKIIFMRVP
ncbi:Von Willebrand factor type [Elusimicrobium minutum Pei191]|uniref:von Willebrand factor type n=1 Tax=Elusimicrobium minutum (strain Pei191) TaxID=445932 RepID=B2KDS9_ELUMP|nr:VWA domain-containing protein [Elusimicrobium minutum]ACC98675.1 Von Willebrand factor type [Elusimicrobium minutum Pei191]